MKKTITIVCLLFTFFSCFAQSHSTFKLIPLPKGKYINYVLSDTETADGFCMSLKVKTVNNDTIKILNITSDDLYHTLTQSRRWNFNKYLKILTESLMKNKPFIISKKEELLFGWEIYKVTICSKCENIPTDSLYNLYFKKEQFSMQNLSDNISYQCVYETFFNRNILMQVDDYSGIVFAGNHPEEGNKR